MNELVNLTTIKMIEQSIYDDNQDIIWPTIVGIFVALALGWMVCRYKCSSKERSPHIVQCCPNSLCKKIRLCCLWIFSSCRLNNQFQECSTTGSRISINSKARSSNNSAIEALLIINNSRLLTTYPNQQWPPSFLLNSNQRSSFSSTSIQLNEVPSQPKRHPLRRESLLSTIDNTDKVRNSSPWPFPTINMDFHKQTNEIKKNNLFFNT